jgi:hypothetical protein
LGESRERVQGNTEASFRIVRADKSGIGEIEAEPELIFIADATVGSFGIVRATLIP